jgi:hypothetical protein
MPGKPSRPRHDGGGVQTLWTSREDPMKIMALSALTSPASTPALPPTPPAHSPHRHVVAWGGQAPYNLICGRSGRESIIGWVDQIGG